MTGTHVTYLGGPTVLLEYAGLRILTDPTFDPPGEYANPGSSTLVKTAGPGLPVAAIEPIDVILLSHHEHMDNLDVAGAALIATGVLTLATPYAAAGLGGSVRGLATGESTLVGGVTITAVPALHGPEGSEPLVGPVTGFVLESSGMPTVYVSGDNASLDRVAQIAARHAPVDLAVLFAGAARVSRIDGALTLTSADAATAARLLGARVVVGVHVEDWAHFSESRADLEAAFAAAGMTGVLAATPRGERVAL